MATYLSPSVVVWIHVFLVVSAGKRLTRDGISGCPVFGCNPGGSFSFQLQLPTSPVRVMWKSQSSLKPLAKALGCVGNSAAIVCPIISNNTVGYGGFSPEDGNLTWTDGILHHPPLPLMDIYGDIIGSDGQKLLQYRVDGTVLQPVIDLFPPMIDIFSLNLADNGIFLLTSSHGVLTTYFTNGVPGGTVTLNYRVKNETGIFSPVTTPVIRGHRSYILTTFKSQNTSSKTNGLLRFFAIDLNDRFVGKIKVAWYIDLRQDNDDDTQTREGPDKASVGPGVFEGSASANGSVLVYQDLIFVTIPPQFIKSQTVNDFWAIRDDGQHGFVKYNDSLQIDDLSVFDTSPVENSSYTAKNYPDIVKPSLSPLKFRKMKLKSVDGKGNVLNDMKRNVKSGRAILWGSVKNKGVIIGFDLTGGDIKTVTKIDLSVLLKATANITSKIMTVRNETDSTDALVFGVNVNNKTELFSDILNHSIDVNHDNYLVALETTPGLSPLAKLMWIFPVPGDGMIEGQVVGIAATTSNSRIPSQLKSQSPDIIIAYSVGETSSNIFAIY